VSATDGPGGFYADDDNDDGRGNDDATVVAAQGDVGAIGIPGVYTPNRRPRRSARAA
jgi:hypothetical protein